MTDEEKAEEYANNEINKIFVDESEEVYVRASTLKQIIKNSHLKGLAEGRKEKWHDLRKNPNDLPEERGDYWIKYDDASEERGSFYDVHYFEPEKPFYKKHWSEIGVMAWCRLPKFEE